MDPDETWNKSKGPRYAPTQKIGGNPPSWVPLRVPKHVLFFCHKPMWPFGHLSCTDFDRFYHAMHSSAKHGLAIACRLTICLSVMLVDHDHIG